MDFVLLFQIVQAFWVRTLPSARKVKCSFFCSLTSLLEMPNFYYTGLSDQKLQYNKIKYKKRKKRTVNNWFIGQRVLIEIWSTRDVWRARKMRRSCSRCGSSFVSASQTSKCFISRWTHSRRMNQLFWNIFNSMVCETGCTGRACSLFSFSFVLFVELITPFPKKKLEVLPHLVAQNFPCLA